MPIGSAGVEFEWSGTGAGDVAAGMALPHRITPPPADDGKTVRYFIRNTTNTQWERALGTWNHATQTLTRGVGEIEGSNGGLLVVFTGGLKIVAWVIEVDDVATATHTGFATAAQIAVLDDVVDGLSYEPANF